MAEVIALFTDTPCTFAFKIEGFEISTDVSVNSLGNLLNAVYNNGGCLVLISLEPKSFNNDLMVVESCLPEILAHLLIIFCNNTVTEFNMLVAWLEDQNPLKFNQSLGHKFYEYKIINFLVTLYEEAGIALKLDYKNIPNIY
ncbi:MAG TPA: HpaII family restriction endonuclease [Pedobacter sp.]|nr:HpaII family restriction endonuclease [Pedobacter sp.]